MVIIYVCENAEKSILLELLILVCDIDKITFNCKLP